MPTTENFFILTLPEWRCPSRIRLRDVKSAKNVKSRQSTNILTVTHFQTEKSNELKNITLPFTTQKWAVYDVKVAHFYG